MGCKAPGDSSWSASPRRCKAYSAGLQVCNPRKLVIGRGLGQGPWVCTCQVCKLRAAWGSRFARCVFSNHALRPIKFLCVCVHARSVISGEVCVHPIRPTGLGRARGRGYVHDRYVSHSALNRLVII